MDAIERNCLIRAATGSRCLAAAVMLLGGVAGSAEEGLSGNANVDPVEWIITPYLWLPSVDGQFGIDGHTAGFDLPIDESIKYLQLGGMLDVEVRRGRVGLVVDGMFMSLEDDASTPGPFFEHVDITFDQAWLDLGLAYRVFENDRGWVDVLAGGRYMYFSVEEDFRPDFDAVDDISGTIVNRTSAAVRGQVEDAVNEASAHIATALAGRPGEIAGVARDSVNRGVSVRVDAGRIDRIVQEEGNRLSEGLARPGTQDNLADTVTGASSERVGRQIQDRVSSIHVDVEARALAAAIQRAMADRLERELAASGDAVKGDAAAIEAAIRKAVNAGLDDLKRNASAATRRGLEQAEKALASKIDAGMQQAAETNVSESSDWVDLYFGARARWLMTPRLYAGLRGDVGGFGIGSGSELVWQLFGGLGYQWTEHIAVEAGWRYFDMDHDNGALSVNAAYSGVILGMSIVF